MARVDVTKEEVRLLGKRMGMERKIHLHRLEIESMEQMLASEHDALSVKKRKLASGRRKRLKIQLFERV